MTYHDVRDRLKNAELRQILGMPNVGLRFTRHAERVVGIEKIRIPFDLVKLARDSSKRILSVAEAMGLIARAHDLSKLDLFEGFVAEPLLKLVSAD